MRIKDLEPADFAAVTRWFNELVAERPGIVEREPVAAGDDAFLREQVAAAARGELIVLLLYPDDRVVGKVDLRRGRRPADRHVAKVSFGLLEGFRAEGQALIAAAAERAAAWGASVLVYYIPARSWFVGVFREAGFTLVGTIPGYYNLDGEVCGRAILARALPGAGRVGGRGAD